MAFTGSITPALIASGDSFATFQKKGVTGLLEDLIAAQVATVAPTAAPTATATGGGATGGSLAAGTYYFVSTETNAFGETVKGPEGLQLTVAATNIPRFTFPTLKAGNVARNLYLGAVGGSTGGPYTLYASGITTTTYDASAAAPTSSLATAPPTVNTTALTFTDANGRVINKALELVRSVERGNGQDIYRYLQEVETNYLRGRATPYGAALTKLYHVRGALLLLVQLCNEIGVLMDANPGTLTITTAGGTVYPTPVRTFP